MKGRERDIGRRTQRENKKNYREEGRARVRNRVGGIEKKCEGRNNKFSPLTLYNACSLFP